MIDNIRRQQLNRTLIDLPLDYSSELKAALNEKEIQFSLIGTTKIEVSKNDLDEINKTINEVILPNLLPTQFYWLLAKAGLETPVNTFLEGIKETNIEEYAIYRGFLRGARFYEFKKSHEMFTAVKPYLLETDPTLQLELEDMKALWKLAAKV